MKRHKLISALLAALALAPLLQGAPALKAKARPAAQAAQALPQALEARKASLTLFGDSSLHKYHSKAAKIALSGQVLPSQPGFAASAAAGGLKSLKAVIAVEGLKSDKEGLDKNLYKTLKSKEFPDIVFEMSGYELKLEGAKGEAKVSGSLSVAGKKADLVMDAKAEVKGDALLIRGVQPLKMTSFGIKPPVMMMGMIRCTDDIRIEYEVELGAAK